LKVADSCPRDRHSLDAYKTNEMTEQRTERKRLWREGRKDWRQRGARRRPKVSERKELFEDT
jgi:hypothetical protein